MKYNDGLIFMNAIESINALSKDQIVLESQLIDLKDDAYINSNADYSEAIESISEKIKETLKKISDFFHKLVIRFGVIIREFMQNQRRKKASKAINDLHGENIEIPFKTVNWLWKIYKDLGLEGWSPNYPTKEEKESGKKSSIQEKFDNDMVCVIPVSTVAKNLEALFKFSKQMDDALMKYVKDGDDHISMSFLNANKITYEEYPGFLRDKAKKATNAIKILTTILNNAAKPHYVEKYIKKDEETKKKERDERNRKYAQKQADKIKKRYPDKDVTVTIKDKE